MGFFFFFFLLLLFFFLRPTRNAEGTYPTLRIAYWTSLLNKDNIASLAKLKCPLAIPSKPADFCGFSPAIASLTSNCYRLSWIGVVQLLNEYSVSLYLYTMIFINGFWLLWLTKVTMVTKVRSKSLTDLFRSLLVDILLTMMEEVVHSTVFYEIWYFVISL